MGKVKFQNNQANLNIVESAMVIDEAYNLIEGRFPEGSYVLPYGDSCGVEWEGGDKPYKAIKIFTFDSFGQPNAMDIMATSVVAYSSYGEKTGKGYPEFDAKESKNGHLVPDADMIASEMPFKLTMKRTGDKNDEGKDLVVLRAEKMQVAKVIGHKYVLVGDYDEYHNIIMVEAKDENGNVILESNGEPKMVCKLRAKRKPIFQLMQIAELPEELQKVLKTQEVKQHFA